MFAASRTARVPGRIRLLIDSMITINGISAPGVLWGTKWANICLVWLIQPNSIKDNHKGAARVKVAIKWLVLVKIYGNKPKKLLITTIRNRERNLRVLPLNEEGPRSVLNSEWRVSRILEIIKLIRFGKNQIRGAIRIIMIRLLIQLEEVCIDEEGSKTENKFVIMFIHCWVKRGLGLH